MEELDEEVRRATVDALRDSGAVFAFIHGSTVRGTARAGSDIDVAAWWASDAPPSFEMRRAAGFRNVLEHEYVAVDDQIVLARPNDPSDLEQFSGQVARWLGQ
jgi:predicted nucleotidyltransferase